MIKLLWAFFLMLVICSCSDSREPSFTADASPEKARVLVIEFEETRAIGFFSAVDKRYSDSVRLIFSKTCKKDEAETGNYEFGGVELVEFSKLASLRSCPGGTFGKSIYSLDEAVYGPAESTSSGKVFRSQEEVILIARPELTASVLFVVENSDGVSVALADHIGLDLEEVAVRVSLGNPSWILLGAEPPTSLRFFASHNVEILKYPATENPQIIPVCGRMKWRDYCEELNDAGKTPE